MIGRGRDETSESKRVATQVNLLCISTLHISLGKSGAARCIRERVYKNTIAIVRSRIMFLKQLWLSRVLLSEVSATCKNSVTRIKADVLF